MDMGSEFYFFLAFVLGVVFGFALRQMLEYRWQFTLYMPKRCPSCRGFHQKRHFKPAHHRAAGWTMICNRCWDFQFRPFSKDETES